MVILNNELKLIKSLRVRTSRYGERLFVAEGSRLVLDILKTNPSLLHLLAGTAEWIKRNEAKLSGFVNILREIAPRQLSDVAGLKTTEEVLAIVKFPEFDQDSFLGEGNGIYLEGISDPGNLGTIIRTADWFGIKEVMLSPGCVDPFNNKCVQSSMSSICRIKIKVLNVNYIREYTQIAWLWAAHLDGVGLNQVENKEKVVICFGNEAHGLSKEMIDECNEVVRIPSWTLGAESLNLAVSAGIFMSYRKMIR
jgi:TrmH family RNA methyltransferase